MSIFDDIRDKVSLKLSEWVLISDPRSKWTIEDFPYDTGVDENLTNPHCWRCVTVNQCWFVNKEDKRPQEFDYSQHSIVDIPLAKRGLYHPNCHDQKIKIDTPKETQIKLIIPLGKINWTITDKGHILKEMGYKEDEFIEAIDTIKYLTTIEFVNGNYTFRIHDKKGYRIGFVLNFPGKHEDYGKIYKLKTGWSIFPNGKLKCNTLIGGLKK